MMTISLDNDPSVKMVMIRFKERIKIKTSFNPFEQKLIMRMMEKAFSISHIHNTGKRGFYILEDKRDNEFIATLLKNIIELYEEDDYC